MRMLLVAVLFSGPSAAQLFTSHCAGCHGLDGRGGEHAPNIATNADIQKLRDADLAHIIRDGIPAAGMPASGTLLNGNEIAAVLKELRALQGLGNRASVPGDPAQGTELFFGRARCGECHTIGGRGGFLGADLSGYGKSHPAADIRSAILAPSRHFDERLGIVAVVTRAGQHLAGVIRNEDNFSLQMQTADGIFHSFDKSALEESKHVPHPVAHLNKLELDNLAAFLATSPGNQSVEAPDGDDDQ